MHIYERDYACISVHVRAYVRASLCVHESVSSLRQCVRAPVCQCCVRVCIGCTFSSVLDVII